MYDLVTGHIKRFTVLLISNSFSEALLVMFTYNNDFTDFHRYRT